MEKVIETIENIEIEVNQMKKITEILIIQDNQKISQIIKTCHQSYLKSIKEMLILNQIH